MVIWFDPNRNIYYINWIEAARVTGVSPQEEIPLVKARGVYTLPVEVNGVLTLPFILDSGAADVHIPADVAITLIRTGTIKETDFLPGQTYILPDGSELRSHRLILRSLKIGKRQITDVPTSVGPPSSILLLGQSFLERLGKWGIDTQRGVLIIDSVFSRWYAYPSPP